MFLFRWPTSLWFLAGGGQVGSEATICVSVTYQISASVGQLNSVDVNLSALAFGLSANLDPQEPPEDSFVSVQVAIDLDDQQYSSIDLRASVTPVFVIEQSGQIDKAVSDSYKVSASLTASLFVDAVPSVTYQVSASLSVVVSAEGQVAVCVSSNYQISASIGVLLQTQLGQLDKSITDQYAISASITPIVRIVNEGGLVWSQKKQRYIAVRVGPIE